MSASAAAANSATPSKDTTTSKVSEKKHTGKKNTTRQEKKENRKKGKKKEEKKVKEHKEGANKILKGHPVPLPESLLKKRAAKKKLKLRREKIRVLSSQRSKYNRQRALKRAEHYVKEYRAREKQLISFKRQAKNLGNFYVPPESKLLFVIRIRGINNIAPKVKKVLQLLRLRQINNGVFVKVNKATHNMLLLCEPYVTYGPPNLKSVRELIYKRGYGKIHHQRIALKDNSKVEKSLGRYNIICVEDLIHEIFTVGGHFKEANNFLWPFKLSSPLGGWTRYKKIHYSEGGDHGNREEDINKLIRRMN